MTSAPKPNADWESVEREYRAGVLSVREIGKAAGVSHVAVLKKAKREGWPARARMYAPPTARTLKAPAAFDRTDLVLGALRDASERGVVNEVLFGLNTPMILEAYGWPAIIRIETEYQVERGRIDILAFHEDGSGTIIECKAARSARDILPAIGQVMSYGLQIARNGLFKSVRLAIASRAGGEQLRPLKPMFEKCGIEPVFCGTLSR